jgi:serine/threonine protein phosphatase PrpC
VEAGMLDEQDAMRHEERHIVSNFVGMAGMRIELGPSTEIAPFDTLLVASDGLTDNLPLQQIVETIRKGPLQAAARRLADLAHRRMTGDAQPCKPDDLTFVLFRRQQR